MSEEFYAGAILEEPYGNEVKFVQFFERYSILLYMGEILRYAQDDPFLSF